MEYREARDILEKYWLGDSTLEEEKRLKDFFHSREDDLPADLQEVAGLFDFYEAEVSLGMSDNPQPEVCDLEVKRHVGTRPVKLWRRYWEYAAIFLLVLGSIWLFRPASRTVRETAAVDTFQSPQKAMEATQKALQVLAANLNKGKAEMQKLSIFNEAEQKVKTGK